MARDPLPDGGSTFRYQVNGDDTLVRVPPAGFDATTADAATLAFYGIPPDPGPLDAAARAEWLEMASSLKFVTPPSSLLSPPAQFTNSANWGGQVGLKGSYKSAYARYTEPAHDSACTGGMASYWAGLGGWAGDANLAQNGTAQGVPGFAMDQAWYEILPAAPVAVNLFATPGKDFEAFTTRNTSDGSFTFFWWNSFTDASLSIKVFSARYSGKSAEFIAERVKVNGVLKPLYKFGTIHVRLNANNDWIGEPNTKAVLVNGGGAVMVQPSDLDFFDKAKFDDVWKRCT